MRKQLPIKRFLWRWLICLTTIAFLLSVVFSLRLQRFERIAGLQAFLPQPPYLGNPGEILLETDSWFLPEVELLRVELPAGLDFSPARLRLAGIGGHGFRWQIRHFFWAVEFGKYDSLQVSYKHLTQTLSLRLEVMPRPDLATLAMPPPPVIQPGKVLLLSSFFAALAMFADLLLGLWSRQRPRKRALRQIEALQGNEADCGELWRIWHQFTLPSAQACWLRSEIRKMQFAPDGLSMSRFSLCKGLMICECRKNNGVNE